MTIWSPRLDEAGPVYLAITRALEADIAGGLLQPGDRLPTHRDLATEIGVNVGTVTRAYGEARRRGLIEGEVGRGTFVRRPERSALSRVAPEQGHGPIDLSVNTPVALASPDLVRTFESMIADERTRPGTLEDVMAYRDPLGDRPLREAGAAWLARLGIPASADQVAICAGAQHGILVSLASIAGPGDLVLAESLTYPGFLASARLLGLRVRGVELDAHGVVPASLDAICRLERPRLLYCMPGLQNPTCVPMPRARREAIAEIAARHDLLLVQDEIHAGLVEDEAPSLAALAPDRTFSIVSLSKLLSPGIRVALLAAPAARMPRISEAIWGSIWMGSPLGAEVARRWLKDDTIDRVLAARREELAARQAMVRERLGELDVRIHPAAFHAWLPLRAPWDEASAVDALARVGVRVSRARDFAVDGTSPSPALRLSITATRDRDRLARAIDLVRETLTGAPPRTALV